jgi:hypothetical protein
MTPVYVLCPPDQRVVQRISPIWAARKVNVIDDDWYAARAKAMQHAAASGANYVIIVANHVELAYRPHWNGLGPETVASPLRDTDLHGLWLYMDRLLRRFAHVYVPHIAACRPWKTFKRHPWKYINNPVLPMVAGYRLSSVTPDVVHDETLGLQLCHRGHDSLTVSDYFYRPLGGLVTLDDFGSHSVWDRAFREAIKEHLG